MPDGTPPRDAHAHQRETAARRRERTVERLQVGIATLEAAGREVTARTVHEVTGIDHRTIGRNPAAIALFREHSTHLQARRPPAKKPHRPRDADPPGEAEPSPVRDPLQNYSRPRLIRKVNALEQQLAARAEQDRQYAGLVQEHASCAMTIERLEARVQQLAKYAEMAKLLEGLRGKMVDEEFESS